MTDLSAKFAERILAIEPATLEAEDHEQVGRLLFDVSACAYGGTRQPTVAALCRWAAGLRRRRQGRRDRRRAARAGAIRCPGQRHGSTQLRARRHARSLDEPSGLGRGSGGAGGRPRVQQHRQGLRGSDRGGLRGHDANRGCRQRQPCHRIRLSPDRAVRRVRRRRCRRQAQRPRQREAALRLGPRAVDGQRLDAVLRRDDRHRRQARACGIRRATGRAGGRAGAGRHRGATAGARRQVWLLQAVRPRGEARAPERATRTGLPSTTSASSPTPAAASSTR